jgi:hypothetical protein
VLSSAAFQPFHELEKKHWRFWFTELPESAKAVELMTSAAVTKQITLKVDCMIRNSIVIPVVDIDGSSFPITT